MLNILTPLPGTQQFADLDAEGRIFDKRWHLYDAHHVVFTPKQMTPLRAADARCCAATCASTRWRQWLKYLFTFRFTKLLFQTWGRHIIRTWRRDKRNKAFMKALKQLPWPHPARLVQGSVKRVSTE